MSRKKIALIILVSVTIVLIIAFLFYAVFGFFWLYDPSGEIERDFSPELIREMENRYGITVPKNSVFLNGYNLYHPQDSYVIVFFEVPLENFKNKDNLSESIYIRNLLSLDETWSFEGTNSMVFHDDWFGKMGGEMQNSLTKKDTSYTSLEYSFENDKVLLRLIGWRPTQMFP